MSKAMDITQKYLVTGITKFANNPDVDAVKNGFMITLPFSIVGSVFLLVASFPSDAFQAFMLHLLGSNWKQPCFDVVSVTFGIMSLVVALAIPYYLAVKFKLDSLVAALFGLTSFLLLTPLNKILASKEVVDNVIPFDWLGASGLFVAIFSSIVSFKVYHYFIKKNIVIKMPEQVPPQVARSFVAILPGLFVVLVMLVIKLIFEHTDYASIHNFIYSCVQKPLQSLGNNVFVMIIALVLCQVLWWFGIHGQNLIFAVSLQPIYMASTLENLAAYQNHQPLPNIITGKFFETFVLLGGSGCTLMFGFALLFMAKSSQLKSLAKLAVPGSIFNVNEPITFGLPIVFNPVMLLPWILTPIVMALIAYLAMVSGFCPYTNGLSIPWTTPVLLSGYLNSGWQGVVVQLVQLVVSFFIFLPFVRILDKRCLAEEGLLGENTNS